MSDTIAGRFTLLDPIASGGSGTVWIARDERLDTLCAAKVLRQRDSGDLLRFVRENTVRLDHPHVLAPYAWAAEDAYVVIAMPLVTGGTLAKVLTAGHRLSAPAAAEAIRQILTGLTAVHAAGWIHRDITPANIMIDAEQPQLHLLVADFGIAVSTEAPRLTHTGIIHGTPGFVAPEILMGAAISPAQDVWAAGQIGRRLLGLSDDTAAEAVRTSRDPLTAGLVHLIDDLTAADPRLRPSAHTGAEALGRLRLRGPYRFADGTIWRPRRLVRSAALPDSPAPTLITAPLRTPSQARSDTNAHTAGSGRRAVMGSETGQSRPDAHGGASAPRDHATVRSRQAGATPRALTASAAVFALLGILLILVGIIVPDYLS